MSQADTNGSSVSVLWAEQDTCLVLLYLASPPSPLPPVSLTCPSPMLFHTHFTGALPQPCVMIHSGRKWKEENHITRLNCKNLANAIRQPNLNIIAVGGSLSWDIKKYFLPPPCFLFLALKHLRFPVFFSTGLYPLTCIFLSCALFFFPSLLFPTSHLASLPALSLAGSHTFPLLLKKEKKKINYP